MFGPDHRRTALRLGEPTFWIQVWREDFTVYGDEVEILAAQGHP